MNRIVCPAALPLIASLLCAPAAAGREASPDQCRRLEERIEHYTELRRGGGSGSKMAAWKRARNEAQAAYRGYNCHLQGRGMIRIERSR